MSFQYRKQPFKSLYLAFIALSTITIRLPFWIITSIPASWRDRPTWSISRVVFMRMLQTYVRALFSTTLPVPPKPEDAARDANRTGFVWIDPTPRYVVGELEELARANDIESERVSGYWYGTRGSDGKVGQKAANTEKVIYHCHGGGYVTFSATPSELMCPNICNGYLKNLPQISRVFCIEYRLASAEPFTPANHFPAAVIDALAGYHYLIHDVGFRPENIIVSGDSAGGHLALSLTRHLAQSAIPELPMQKNLLLLSPTVEWVVTHVGPQASEKANASSDYCHPFFEGYSARALVGKLPADAGRTNSWISPGSLDLVHPEGIFIGFPRTYISVGEAEFGVDSMRTFRDRLVRDIGEEKVVYIETYGATHDFLGFAMHEPERTQALQEIAKWVEAA